MSRHEESFLIRYPAHNLRSLCHRTVLSLGWRVDRESDTGLVCCEGSAIVGMTYPASIEIIIQVLDAQSGRITLRGSNFGFGPIQSGHVKKQTICLRERIEHNALQPEPAPQAPDADRNVVVNGVQLPSGQVAILEGRYNARIPDGVYWYDTVCGAWGLQGGPALCLLEAGLNLGGPLRADASNGNTRVFINGRELHMLDVFRLQQVVPVILPGRWWMDGYGNFGYEGGPMLGNLWAIAQSPASMGGGGQREGVLSSWDRTGVAVFSG